MQTEPQRLLNQWDLSDRWRVSPRTLERWRWEGRGPHYLKIGNRIAYTNLHRSRPCALTAQSATPRVHTNTRTHPSCHAGAVVLCLIDLKLTRLQPNPTHQDSVCDLAGYAAVLQEVNR